MKHTCIVTDEKKINVLKIRTVTAASELSNTLGRCYGKLMQFIQENNIQMSGAPFAVYYNMDMDNLDIEAGIPIASEASGQDDIVFSNIPDGKYVSTVHIGPYESVEAAYHDLSAYTDENNLKPSGIAYEFYLNDPGEVKPEDIQTRIMFSLL